MVLADLEEQRHVLFLLEERHRAVQALAGKAVHDLEACRTQLVDRRGHVVDPGRDVIEAGPTELLIEALFDPANNTLSKAQALQAARANVRATFPHPTHWATFSLIGDGR